MDALLPVCDGATEARRFASVERLRDGTLVTCRAVSPGDRERLVLAFSRIASERGVARFDADVLHGNAAMLGVFARSGLPARRSVDCGVVRLAMSLSTTH